MINPTYHPIAGLKVPPTHPEILPALLSPLTQHHHPQIQTPNPITLHKPPSEDLPQLNFKLVATVANVTTVTSVSNPAIAAAACFISSSPYPNPLIHKLKP
jgi:hypothetical protein